MQWKIYRELESLPFAADEFLAAKALLNNIPLGVLQRMRQQPLDFPERYIFTIENEASRVIAYAHHTPPHPLCLAAMSSLAAGELARNLARTQYRFERLHGMRQVVDSFLEGYPDLHSTMTMADAQALYRIEEVRSLPDCSGKMQLAQTEHLPLLIAWLRAFHDECRLPPMTEQYWRAHCECKMAANELCLWVDRGQPVAMACVGRHLPRARSIGWVYTPEPLRGRGYASHLVQELSQRLLAAGHDYLCLFAQLANPVANRIYQRIGFDKVGEFVELRCLDP